MVFNSPFTITGHIGPSNRRVEMKDDVMKHPLELSWDPDFNPQPLVHQAGMLPLTYANGPMFLKIMFLT